MLSEKEKRFRAVVEQRVACLRVLTCKDLFFGPLLWLSTPKCGEGRIGWSVRKIASGHVSMSSSKPRFQDDTRPMAQGKTGVGRSENRRTG